MEFCDTGMSSTNYGFLIMVSIICRILDRFLAVLGFCLQHLKLVFGNMKFLSTQPVSGSAVAVNGQSWTILIESGCMPILAPCHISTGERTLSQLQILAAGHFLAEGISCPSQTYTQHGHTNSTQTHTLIHTHSRTDTHKCKNAWAGRTNETQT